MENHLGKALAPYEEFALGAKTHYVGLGGMLHHKGPGSEEGEGYFCGYLDDEVWHHLKNYLKKRRRVATTGDASRLGIYQIRSP